jgi:hypothetical protein
MFAARGSILRFIIASGKRSQAVLVHAATWPRSNFRPMQTCIFLILSPRRDSSIATAFRNFSVLCHDGCMCRPWRPRSTKVQCQHQSTNQSYVLQNNNSCNRKCRRTKRLAIMTEKGFYPNMTYSAVHQNIKKQHLRSGTISQAATG